MAHLVPAAIIACFSSCRLPLHEELSQFKHHSHYPSIHSPDYCGLCMLQYLAVFGHKHSGDHHTHINHREASSGFIVACAVFDSFCFGIGVGS